MRQVAAVFIVVDFVMHRGFVDQLGLCIAVPCSCSAVHKHKVLMSIRHNMIAPLMLCSRAQAFVSQMACF